MKVSSGGFDFSAAQSLLPVGPAVKGGSGDLSAGSSDVADSQDFGSLLSRGVSDSESVTQSAKAGSGDARHAAKVGASKASPGLVASRVSRAQQGSGVVLSKGSRDLSNSQDRASSLSLSEFVSGDAGSSDAPELDVKVGGTGELLALGLSDLPPDPRLADPSELAMEAAAVAALSAASSLVIPVSVQSSVSAESDGSGVALQVSVQGNGAGSQGGPFGQLAQIASRASSSEVSVPKQVSVPPTEISPVQQTAAADLQSNVSLPPSGPVIGQTGRSDSRVQVEVLAGVPVKSNESSSLDADSSLSGAVVSVPVEGQAQSAPVLPISSPLISLTATSAQLAALVAASSQKVGLPRAVASDKVAASAALPAKLAGDVRSAVLAAEVFSSNNADPSGQGASIVAAGSAEEPVVQPQSSSLGLAGVAQENGSGKSGAVGVGDEGKNASGSGLEQESRASEQGGHGKPVEVSARAKARLPDAELRSGTRDANELTVPKEETSVRVRATAESLPASIDEAPQSSAFVDKADSSQSAVSSAIGAGNRPLSEAVSKPTVLPPVQVKTNEVWRVVQDAIQRARSENPSHLAVEVRMDDGSTLGVELRMSSTGLQASFRSESQTLLRSIESQWSTFVSKETADARVTSAVFESRSSFGGSTDSGTSGGERRQQMEDALSASSLGQMGESGSDVSAKSGLKSSQAGSVQNGRITAYA